MTYVTAWCAQVLGYLMENEGAIWLVYVLLGEATLGVLAFLFLLLFARLYLQPRYPSSRAGRDVVTSLTTQGAQPDQSRGLLDKEGVEAEEPV